MAKANNNKSLAVVETGENTANYFLSNYTPPQNAKRLNLPRLIKGGDMPIGAALSGEIIAVIENFTGKADMKNSQVLHLKTESGNEILFPLTGVIKKALSMKDGKPCEPTDYIGETIHIVRQPDGMSGKYKKAMFVFDVYIAD